MKPSAPSPAITRCPRCGSKRLFRNWDRVPQCLDCGYIHHDNPDLDALVCRPAKKHERRR